jgi:hypothetical protein
VAGEPACRRPINANLKTGNRAQEFLAQQTASARLQRRNRGRAAIMRDGCDQHVALRRGIGKQWQIHARPFALRGMWRELGLAVS